MDQNAEVIEQAAEEVAAELPEVVEQAVEPQAKQEEKEAALPKGVQKRIDRAVRDKYEAQARAKMLEERLAALEARANPPAKVADKPAGAPRLEDFDNLDDYVTAKAEYIAEQKITSTLTEREKREKAERESADRAKTVETWQSKVAAVTAELPDFVDVVESSDIEMTDAMQAAIMHSDIGPKLAYYLATHEDEAMALSKMQPIAVIREMTRIEDKINAGALSPKQETKAPSPVNPVGTKAKVEKDPTQMTDTEFAKWRRMQIAKRNT